MSRTILHRLFGVILLSAAVGAHAANGTETSYLGTVVGKGTFTQDYYFITDSEYNPQKGVISASGVSSLFGDLELKVLDQSGVELTTDWLKLGVKAGSWQAVFVDKKFDFNLAASTKYIVRVSGTSVQEKASFYINGAFVQSISPVPEPETYSMLLAGLGLIGAIALRRGRQS